MCVHVTGREHAVHAMQERRGGGQASYASSFEDLGGRVHVALHVHRLYLVLSPLWMGL